LIKISLRFSLATDNWQLATAFIVETEILTRLPSHLLFDAANKRIDMNSVGCRIESVNELVPTLVIIRGPVS